MNKHLLNLNKTTLNDSELSQLNKQQIIGGLKSNHIDNNDELAIILNVLQDNISLLKDTISKDKLIELLNKRNQIKKEIKEGE